ncbi:hypothetical protein PRIPAC_87903 [Pristionchus pacificus]|uniref:Uncharacterized protein n=1 Tax=Pristionchus pacificus TaxID=54126 RepID=A0A2A6CVU2_PRIPA|nr:hypothetical protein PRIPAC_87903 [Pristionchus pacificus]|eukprot:PDM82163.1 hypothetical protein PRIPAC_36556 [Pristionchus pacificus]
MPNSHKSKAELNDSLIAGSCGKTCHSSGSFHSSPYDDTDSSIVIGTLSCAGSLFDFNNGGSVLCSYSTPSSVLFTSNACNVPSFACVGCDSSAVRYFDYDADYYQILCESGLIQYTYSDNSTHEYDYRLHLNKNTCAVSGGEDSSKTITSVSCKAQTYELDTCLQNAGSPSGVTGHCHFGTCWLYCSNNTEQLSFTPDLDGVSPRVNANNLVCESGFTQYGQSSAFNLQCN